VGYCDSAEAALQPVKNDFRYEAIWASLKPFPRVRAITWCYDGYITELGARRAGKEDL
jgi:hypothetical protein